MDSVTLEPGAAGTRSQHWLARLSFVLAAVAVVIVVVYAELRSFLMLAAVLAGAVVTLAAAFFFLSRRGALRWASLAAMVLAPIGVIIGYAFAGLLWVAIVSAAAWVLAGVTARSALVGDQAAWRMPEHPAEPPAARPYLIMNPRSGGGKVEKFDLKRKAEEFGAEVFMMSGPEPVDVAEVAREAVARGADLLGVAGGDGTQALVAGIAAQHGIPFMVITAGTRNHFALDLGLDRENPAACLSALSNGVELRVDLGVIGGQTFVNNASFGAYAAVVESPAYRGDKLNTTLKLLPDLLQGHRGARLSARADDVEIRAPQALLVANNPYGTGDIAGLSRRARLDRGILGIVGVRVRSARQAVGLLRGARATGLSVLAAKEIEITADAPHIPVGIDGESVSLPTPVHCTIHPGALRVWVPRDRPGVTRPKPPVNWATLRHLAAFRRQRRPPAAVTAAPEPAEEPHLGADRQLKAGSVRPRYERIADLGELMRHAGNLHVRTMIFDVEPLVAYWDSGQEVLDQGIARVCSEVGAMPDVQVLCFATNSLRRPSIVPGRPGLRVVYLAAAGKPLRTAPYRDFPRPGVVIGDQVGTDGILARRLDYAFVLYDARVLGAPAGPRLMGTWGKLVRPLLYTRHG